MAKTDEGSDMIFVGDLRSSFPEHPNKIAKFKEKMKGIKWDSINQSEEFQKMFDAVDDLADAEVRYYFRRRKTRAFISGITRIFGWFFGGIGVLLPLIASTDPSRKDIATWGFVFIAIAASAFAANNLFGGTTGHVSFVQTQISIESLIIQNRIEWQKILSESGRSEMSAEKKTAAFDLIKKYAENLAKISAAETLNWRNDILEAMSKFASTLNQK